MTDPVDTDALRDMADALGFDDGHAFGLRARAAADEVDRLHAVIENAPHDNGCGSISPTYILPCTCWKAGAL